MQKAQKQGEVTKKGCLAIPPEKRRVGSPFIHGMPVTVIGQDPKQDGRLIVFADSIGERSMPRGFVRMA